jgi:hypothetical protein
MSGGGRFTPPRTAAEARAVARQQNERNRKVREAKDRAQAERLRQLEEHRRRVKGTAARGCLSGGNNDPQSNREQAAPPTGSLSTRQIYAARAGRTTEEKKDVEKPASAPRRPRTRSFDQIARAYYGTGHAGAGTIISSTPRGGR